jgi:hypothetical protein
MSKPPEINVIDHQIHCQNGLTSVLEFTAQRLRYGKMQTAPDLMARIEELTKEMGYLRQEIQFYRECFSILHRLRETAYDVYQQLFLACYFGQRPDQLQQLTAQLHSGLEDSVKREAKAEKCWKDFWGIECNQQELEGELI